MNAGPDDYVLISSDVEPVLHGVCAGCFDNGECPSHHQPVLVQQSRPENSPGRESELTDDIEPTSDPSDE